MNVYTVPQSQWDELQSYAKRRETDPAATLPKKILLPEPEHVQMLQDVNGHSWICDESGYLREPGADGRIDHISVANIDGWSDETPLNFAAMRGEAVHNCGCHSGYVVFDMASTRLPDFRLRFVLDLLPIIHPFCSTLEPDHFAGCTAIAP